MTESHKNPDELGSLWLKSGPTGDYMTGTIQGEKVVVFKNTHKPEGSNQPDWRVLRSKPKAVDPARMTPAAPLTKDDIPF